MDDKTSKKEKDKFCPHCGYRTEHMDEAICPHCGKTLVIIEKTSNMQPMYG